MFEDKGSLLCRLCLKSGDCPIDIFDPQGTNGLLVWEIIKEFTEIETSHSDGLPRTICKDCMKKLTDFKYFKKMCINSRKEFLFHKINDGFVVPMTEDESGPSGGDLRGQGEDHTRDTWNNLEAEGIESEVPIKMEEVDLSEETENVSPDSIGESMEDEHSELADVESQFHVKNEVNTEEITLPEEYLSNSGEKVSSEEVRYSDVYGSASEICTTEERDFFEEPPPERENSSISVANCSDVEEHFSDIHNSENVMHVKREDVEKEIPPPEEYLSPSSEKGSVEEVQCSNVHSSASEVAMDKEEVMDQDDLCLQLSSSSSDESSDVEERALGITGPGAEVNGLHCTDEISVPVDGDVERLGNSDETLIREKGPNRVKVTGHQRSARKENDTILPVETHSHLKHRRLRSHCMKENYGPDEDIESTPSSNSGKLFCEENGGHTERKEETRRESRHGNGALAANISIGSSVGDEKSEGQDFMCDECGKVFGSKDLVERHVKVPCGQSDVLECTIRSIEFRNKNNYKRHRSLPRGSNVSRRRVQRGVSVDLCGEFEGMRQIKERIPPTCHICNKIFSHNANLNRHIKTVHLKERKFSCEICGKSFGQKGTLQSHMRYHNGVKPYACSHCEMGFTQSGTLRQHVRAVHEMQKPHTCGECGKAFSHKPHLKTHMLVHTGERPHTCGICSKTFSLKQNLERHMLIHTGEKPHTCNVCPKTFRHNCSLKHHMATHAEKVPH